MLIQNISCTRIILVFEKASTNIKLFNYYYYYLLVASSV